MLQTTPKGDIPNRAKSKEELSDFIKRFDNVGQEGLINFVNKDISDFLGSEKFEIFKERVTNYGKRNVNNPEKFELENMKNFMKAIIVNLKEEKPEGKKDIEDTIDTIAAFFAEHKGF